MILQELKNIVKQLRINTLHLEEITDNIFKEKDLEEI